MNSKTNLIVIIMIKSDYLVFLKSFFTGTKVFTFMERMFLYIHRASSTKFR